MDLILSKKLHSQARCQPWAFITIWKPILSGYLHYEMPVEFMNFYLLLNALSTYWKYKLFIFLQFL